MILKFSALLVIISMVILVVKDGKRLNILELKIELDWYIVFIALGTIFYVLNTWRFL